MRKTKRVTSLEEICCENCLFSAQNKEYASLVCVREPVPWEEIPIPNAEFCGQGAWFVGNMDLVHNIIQAAQYFQIKEKQEAEDKLKADRDNPEK